MSEDQKTRLWVLVVLVVVTALLGPIFLSEPSSVFDQTAGGGWRDIIYDFQTLFTGILAIGAAAFTIIQSRIIEERQQIRHEQLFDLQVRPDKLRIARAYAHFDILRLQREACPRWSPEAMLNRLVEIGEFTDNDRSEIARIKTFCNIIGLELTRDELVGAKDLFDGPLHTQLNLLNYNLDAVLRSLEPLHVPNDDKVVVRHASGVQTMEFMTFDKKLSLFGTAAFHWEPVLFFLDAFLKGFEELAMEYKVVEAFHVRRSPSL
ncbi:hypothetical protein At1D132_03330 [Agrobacterium fabrum]|nr:hypothetical protein At1D132_03330 [Agrobacterium fabrum]